MYFARYRVLMIWPSRIDCFCNYQFNVKACSIQGIFKTADVIKNDPESVACPVNSIDVMSKPYLEYVLWIIPDWIR